MEAGGTVDEEVLATELQLERGVGGKEDRVHGLAILLGPVSHGVDPTRGWHLIMLVDDKPPSVRISRSVIFKVALIFGCEDDSINLSNRAERDQLRASNHLHTHT